MHPNPSFRGVEEHRALADAKQRGFGVLTLNGPDGILASHIPFLTEDKRIAAHIVRSNPIARVLRSGPVEGLLIVSGPDGYISSDWYGQPQLLSTWNYVAIHIRGEVRALPEEDLRPHLEALSAFNEQRLLPKKPWTMDKMDAETLVKLMRTLVPIEIGIRDIASTYKLSQNRGEPGRHAVADVLESSPFGHNTDVLVQMMREAEDS